MMEAMQRVFWNGVSAAATRPEVPSTRADSTCRVHPRPCRQYGVCVRLTLRDMIWST